MEQEVKTPETQEQPIGILFESINYYKLEDLNTFIDNINHEQALYCLIQAAQSAFKKNVYNMAESEVLLKSIRKLSTPNSD